MELVVTSGMSLNKPRRGSLNYCPLASVTHVTMGAHPFDIPAFLASSIERHSKLHHQDVGTKSTSTRQGRSRLHVHEDNLPHLLPLLLHMKLTRSLAGYIARNNTLHSCNNEYWTPVHWREAANTRPSADCSPFSNPQPNVNMHDTATEPHARSAVHASYDDKRLEQLFNHWHGARFELAREKDAVSEHRRLCIVWDLLQARILRALCIPLLLWVVQTHVPYEGPAGMA